MSVYFHFCPAL